MRSEPPARDYRAQVAAIRRSRLHPRPTDHLYLHLRRLRDDLDAAIRGLPVRDVLDVYCGARPYEPLFGAGVRYVGLDVDDAYGCADVVTDEFLPFPDESFDLCLCTQAFYFVPEPERAVAELARVLRPGGHAVLTLPVVYPGTERLYAPVQLRELFAEWDDVRIVENGRTAVSIATLSAYFVHQVAKRLPHGVAPVFAVVYAALNAAGEAADRLERRFLASAESLPANLLVRATRPRPAA
ncbi:MAG: class I SAM-dependent methyltransferase [Actinomycetota bacterium]|nr:class I SAM-dependent methyltransferase [Actinomycetota bacterium]